jgi:hypothetical protein
MALFSVWPRRANHWHPVMRMSRIAVLRLCGKGGVWAATVIVLVSLLWAHVSLTAPTTAGLGAGGVGHLTPALPTPTLPAASCDMTDTGTCLAQSIFSWIATQVQQTVQPITDSVLQNDIDIIYQTPAEDSYQNSTVMTINAAFVVVMDVALATLLLIGAYNLMIGEHVGLPHASFGELIGRLVLVVCAIHFNLYFLGLFVELENALALEVNHATGIAQLANLLAGLVTNPGMTVLTFLLLIIISIFVLWLLGQMIVRIALVAVCLALAPLGLGCLMLPQTMRWGRLWLTTFASAIMVQLVQVTALSLGGVFLTELASTSLLRLDKQIAVAFLAIGMLFLVLKIPGMMQQWALHPMMQFGGKGGSGGGSGGDGGTSKGDSGNGGSDGGSGNSDGGSGGSSTGGTSGSGSGNTLTLWGETSDAYVFQSMLI